MLTGRKLNVLVYFVQLVSSDMHENHLRFDCNFRNAVASRVVGYAGGGIQQVLQSKERNISHFCTSILLWFISLLIYCMLCLLDHLESTSGLDI